MTAGTSQPITGSTVMLWMRTDQPRETGMEYWRGPHSQLVARTPGFLEYRQHHFPADGRGMWPATDGVETDIPDARRIDGVPEVVFTSPVAFLKGLIHNRKIHADEANVFGRTILHSTPGGGGRWFEAADTSATAARTVVFLRRRPGTPDDTFATLVNDTLGPALARTSGVTEVRTHVFAPFKAWQWNTPGVAHDYPESDRLHASMIVGARDTAALAQALASPAVQAHTAEIVASTSAVHAYPVCATYTYRREGRPTLPQTGPQPKPPLQPVRRDVTAAPPMPPTTVAFPSAVHIPLPGRNPEDVVAGADGLLYCGLEGGAIVAVDPTSGNARVAAETGGRPLGLEALPDGRLLVCDAHRGLLRVDIQSGGVETLTQYVNNVPLRFCSNAAMGDDGVIWFTESTNRYDFEQYLGALLEHRPSGRLLRRDPDGRVEVVLDDLFFANGVALTPERDALLLVETGGYRISRVPLNGAQAGQRLTVADNLPGHPDNLSTFTGGRAWVAFPSPRSPALDKAGTLPGTIRKLIWKLPDRLTASPSTTTWVRAISADGTTLIDLHDQRTDFAGVTGVAELDGQLYLASPEHATLLRVELPPSLTSAR